MTLYWLMQQSADVPDEDGWLSASERAVHDKLWAPKRRRDWRLGRWTAKSALVRAGALGDNPAPTEWSRMTIRANEAGVPCLLVDDAAADWELSISHSGDCGLATVARKPVALGCDVETIGRRGEEFVIDWFTDSERSVAAQVDPDAKSRVVTVIWSAKESALKALGVGLRLDTREVEVELANGCANGNDWRPICVRARERRFHGWWRVNGDRALTLVADPAPNLPTALA